MQTQSSSSTFSLLFHKFRSKKFAKTHFIKTRIKFLSIAAKLNNLFIGYFYYKFSVIIIPVFQIYNLNVYY